MNKQIAKELNVFSTVIAGKEHTKQLNGCLRDTSRTK